MVIDECYVILDSSNSFRSMLQNIGEAVTKTGVQCVMLTATLPPVDTPRLFRMMKMDPYKVIMHRTATTRKNVHYTVKPCRAKDRTDITEVVAEVRRLQEKVAGNGRIIVYSNTTKRVDALAAALGCPAYHAGKGKVDAEKAEAEKAESLRV